MRKVIGWPLCHGLYWLGHFFSLMLNWIPEDNSAEMDGWYFTLYYWALYQPYQRCMLWSADVNDWAGLALWGRPER